MIMIHQLLVNVETEKVIKKLWSLNLVINTINNICCDIEVNSNLLEKVFDKLIDYIKSSQMVRTTTSSRDGKVDDASRLSSTLNYASYIFSVKSNHKTFLNHMLYIVHIGSTFSYHTTMRLWVWQNWHSFISRGIL